VNPRRIHHLMREHFPAFDAAKLEWTNILEADGPNSEVLDVLLGRHIDASEVLVEVHRKLGAVVSRSEAANFIASHIGEGQIRVADRQFTSFIVVARNGVATGWRSA
jgi:hypothetical protein